MGLTIVPSIDLRGGKVVRLQQGDYARQLDYDVDPLKVAESFREAGAQWMHVVDLDGAKEGRPVQSELIKWIVRAAGLKLQAGGGIRERSHIEELLGAGVSRVVVGTKALEDWDWFDELAHDPALDRKLVLAVDAKAGVVATRGWTQSAGRLATEVAREVSDWPLGGILYTDVAKDGMMQGPNFEETQKIAEAGKVPVIASGGVGSLEHIRELKKLPIWGAIVGRSLYEGKVNLAEAIQIASH
jgi:phosphoribosylformimino-5-aminoimidazole carboxamide ribotide isomerase